VREVGINAGGVLAIHAMRMTKQYRRLLEGHRNG
jgi:hypothetical protein